MREYTYGPFQSRRLKLSLGVDVLPKNKRCTFDCVYCEIGPTGKSQLVSPSYRIKSPPSHNFRKELISILKHVPHLNSITFGYNGEPTLNEDILDFLKIASDVRDQLEWTEKRPDFTLFTNSTTLHFDDIRERVMKFDLVLAKLDCATQEDFERTSRPHKDTPKIEEIIESLIKLKKEMPKNNKLAIQCLICSSYKEDYISNDNQNNINQLANALKRIKPDIIQLYSIARIPAQYYVFAIDEDKKKEIVEKFKTEVNDESVEINYY